MLFCLGEVLDAKELAIWPLALSPLTTLLNSSLRDYNVYHGPSVEFYGLLGDQKRL